MRCLEHPELKGDSHTITASKNHKHSVNNPYSQFRAGYTPEQVLNSQKITNELTKFMCSPTSVSILLAVVPFHFIDTAQDGAACCIIASEDFVHAHKLENQAIEVVANALTTDLVGTFEDRSAMQIVGFGMTQACGDIVFEQAGFKHGEGRDQVAVVELHDCFAANEVCLVRNIVAYFAN